VVETPRIVAGRLPPNARGHLHIHVVSQGLEHFRRLLGEFAGWGEDEYLWLPQCCVDDLKRTYSEDARLP
jgi:hypothetical protein